jgi:hypothetical protein
MALGKIPSRAYIPERSTYTYRRKLLLNASRKITYITYAAVVLLLLSEAGDGFSVQSR